MIQYFHEAFVDLFNIRVVVGEINADRSNYRFSVIPGKPYQYGACQFEVDFKSRVAEPDDSVKGEIARVYLYMTDRYQIRLSEQQRKLFETWNSQFPVTTREKLLYDRTAVIMGNANPYVTAISALPQSDSSQVNVTGNTSFDSPSPTSNPIRANVKSGVYHLFHCPSYNKMSDKNVREFSSEQMAIDAGFRRAGNCR